MEPIDLPIPPPMALQTLPRPRQWATLLTGCWGLLPYLMYLSLGGFVAFLGWGWYQAPRELGQRLGRSGLGFIALLLLINPFLAVDSQEATLQLAHFLPYFALWSALVGYLKTHPDRWQILRRWSATLVASAPLVGGFALVEYGLKQGATPLWPRLLQTLPPLDWLYTGLPTDPRAYSVFNSPNTLANYSVAVMGLTLGHLLVSRAAPTQIWGRLAALISLGIALYCSGSRNGYLAALVVLAVGLWGFRRHRWGRWLGIMGLAGLVTSALLGGLAGRTPSWDWVTADPRVYVWRLALRLWADRPWWGHGLGSYKLLYDGSVPGYDGIPHAHNLWLGLGAEAGLGVTLGLTAVVGWLCYGGWRGWQRLPQGSSERAIATGYGLAFLAMVLFALFDVTLYDARLNLLAWLCLAVIGGLGEWPLMPTEGPAGLSHTQDLRP